MSDYEPRFYRDRVRAEGLATFTVVIEETDLLISADSDLTDLAVDSVYECRQILKSFIALHPVFLSSLEPVGVPDSSPDLILKMAAAGSSAGVGPMAAVAGAVAEYVGTRLLETSREVIVENGGDVFVVAAAPRRMAVYAGDSPLSNQMAIIIDPGMTPCGICASSGMFGHSKSFGAADAAVAIAPDAALADAWATRLGNEVRVPADIERAIELARDSGVLTGALIIKDDVMAAWGDMELEPLA